MSRRLAFAHIVLGLLGLLGCIVMFIRFARPVRDSLEHLGDIAESTQAELELTISMTREGEQVLSSLQLTAEANQRTVQEGKRSIDEIRQNLNRWKSQLGDLSRTAREASQVSDSFASVLPLELPVLTYTMDKVQLDIPSVKLKEQSVELPYPTAKLGARKETVDLGVTEIEFSVPTLEVGTSQRKLTIPASPEVSIESREFQIPKDFSVDKQQILANEKRMLQKVSGDLVSAASNFSESAAAIEKLERLADREVRDSISATEAALSLSIKQLEKLRTVQLPEFQSRLIDQHRQLAKSQPVFGEMSRAVPWLFALLSLLPIGMVVQGLWMLTRS